MIVQIRVDARLIHGQVVLGWTKVLHTPGILVIDDEAATTDKLTASGLHMAVQAAGNGDIKLIIKTLEDGLKFLKDPRMENFRLFLVTRYLPVAWAVVEDNPGQVMAVNCANLGYHKNKIPEAEAISLYNTTVDQQDVDCLNNLVNTPNLEVFHQITPELKYDKIIDILKDANLYKPA